MPNFKKTRGFNLKSGNTPSGFKMMGSETPSPITSPANMNSFGVGKGTSPYKGKVDWSKAPAVGTKERAAWYKENNLAPDNTTKVKGAKEETPPPATTDTTTDATVEGNDDAAETEGGKSGGGWKKAGGIFVGALTSGLDAVYGNGKVMPTGSARLTKSKDDKETSGPSKTAQELLAKPVTGFPTDSTKVTGK